MLSVCVFAVYVFFLCFNLNTTRVVAHDCRDLSSLSSPPAAWHDYIRNFFNLWFPNTIWIPCDLPVLLRRGQHCFYFLLIPQSLFVFDLKKQTVARHGTSARYRRSTTVRFWNVPIVYLSQRWLAGWLMCDLFRLQSFLRCTSPNLSLLIFPISSNEKKKASTDDYN